MSVADRLKDSLFALVRAALPTVDYFALYRAKVVAQSADLEKLDLQPDDPRLPGMSEVPIKLGVPGATVQVNPGAFVLVGWEGGDPQRPHALVWESGAAVVKLVLEALLIELGGSPAIEALIKGTSYRAAEDVRDTALIAAFTLLHTAAAGPLVGFEPGMAAVLASLNAFKSSAAAAGGFLSTTVKTR